MKAHKRAMKRHSQHVEEAWFTVRVDIDRLALLIENNFSDGSTQMMVLNVREAALLTKELQLATASLQAITEHKKKSG